MSDNPEKKADKVGILGDVRIETAYIFAQEKSKKTKATLQQKDSCAMGESPSDEDSFVTKESSSEQDSQKPQKILEPSTGASFNQNINTHVTALNSCQEYLSEIKVSLHKIYRSTSGKTSQVSKSDLRDLMQLLSNADGLVNKVWQEICEEEDGL